MQHHNLAATQTTVALWWHVLLDQVALLFSSKYEQNLVKITALQSK